MAVLRQFNILGQERLDVPHFRAMESAVAADFDLLMGMMVCGKRSLILDGFKVVTTGAIGAKATALQVVTAGAKVAHYNASESGTIFFVPSDRTAETLSPTNSRVTGSFTANTVNYVGIDIRRSSDDSTADTAMFLDADTLKETPKTVPLGRTLDYVFVISTTDFTSTPTIAAVAKITTDASNNVTAIEDAREMLFRLAKGGSVPDFKNAFSWPEGRLEVTSGDVFTGGDRAIGDMKSWMDAVMTRAWEIGGGERWFSSVSDRNVKMVRTGALFTNGEHFEWDGTHLHWKGIRFVFPNSTGWFNDVADQTANSAGLTDLADGDCIYADLDFATNRTGGTAILAAKTSTRLLGSPTAPGSRHIMAWRIGTSIFVRDGHWAVGSHFNPATTTSLGVVKLSKAPIDPAQPVVLTNTERDAADGVAALDAQMRVMGNGLQRGAAQGAGSILIGGLSNDQAIVIQGRGDSPFGAACLVTDQKSWFQNEGGVTFQVDNGGIPRLQVSTAGDVWAMRHTSMKSIHCKEVEITSWTGNFEDTDQFPAAGGGTIAGNRPAGGKALEFMIKIVTSGGLGVGEFQISYDSGMGYNGVNILIPGGGIYTDTPTGVSFTFVGAFVQGDIYRIQPRFTPQATFSDTAGRTRYVIDHNGYPLGRRGQFYEGWDRFAWTGVTSIAQPNRWAMSTDLGGTVSNSNADAQFNSDYAVLTFNGASNTNTLVLYTQKFWCYVADSTSFVAEWEMTVNTGANITTQIGFRDGAGFGNGGIYFEKTAGGGWQCVVSGAGVTTVGTIYSGVGEGGNIGRFRIELKGRTITGTANRRAVFFINEDRVAEIENANVGTGAFLFSILTRANADAQNMLVWCGPIDAQWNRLLSAPAL